MFHEILDYHGTNDLDNLLGLKDMAPTTRKYGTKNRGSCDLSVATNSTGQMTDEGGSVVLSSTPVKKVIEAERTDHSNKEISVCEAETEAKAKVIVEVPHKHRRSVSFSFLQVREYARTVGDHPGVGQSSGPPISLDWNMVREKSYPVDFYEKHRLPRRDKEQYRLSSSLRRKLLKDDWGCTVGDLMEAERIANKVTIQRQMTFALLPWADFEEVYQSLKRKIARLNPFRKKAAKLEWLENDEKKKRSASFNLFKFFYSRA